jgi:signal transduction histidine kinase
LIVSESTLSFQVRDPALEIARLREMNQTLVMLLSHELGTPLTHVLAYLRLQQERAPQEVRAELDPAVNQALTLKARLDDLLLLNQLEAGTCRVRRAPVLMEEILRRVVEAEQWRAEEKGLYVQLEADCAKPVSGDRELLFRALEHVVANACKFSRARGMVQVHARVVGPDCCIAVTDEGIGIPDDKQEHIFEPFYQVDLKRSRRYAGMGIGLRLVRAIMDGHGGTVQVASQEGRGSTFTLTLPLA